MQNSTHLTNGEDIVVRTDLGNGYTALDLAETEREWNRGNRTVIFLDATGARALRDAAQRAVDSFGIAPEVPSAVYKILLETRPGPGEVAAAYAQWNRVVSATAHAYGVLELELFAQLKADAIARV